jgi:hypothetical protein
MNNGNTKETKTSMSKSMIVEYLLDDKEEDMFVFPKQ